MDSEDSHDGSGDTKSSSSSSSSSSRSRRSSSTDRSEGSKKGSRSPPRSPPKSPPKSPRSEGPRSPSPESQSQSSLRSPSPTKSPRYASKSPSEYHGKSPHSPPNRKILSSPGNLSGAHSDINSPENSMPGSPEGPKSPEGPHSPSDGGSNVASPEHRSAHSAGDGPKSPQSAYSSARSAPGSPGTRSRPASPDFEPQTSSPGRQNVSQPRSPSPERALSHSSRDRSPLQEIQRNPKEPWRRHTKAEQKMVPAPRSRSGSESSRSSRSSSYNKRSSVKDPATEEISEGEMESDQEEDRKSPSMLTVNNEKNEAKEGKERKDINISHEDLSDVSDLDSAHEDNEKDEKKQSLPASPEPKEEIKVNGNNIGSTHSSPKSDAGKVDIPKLEKVPQEKTSNTEDGEEQLDFEAEEGECVEPKPKDQTNGDNNEVAAEKEEIKAGKRSRGSSLEEGEVSDEGEKRPEESEPRPVCRFFSRGACTWGVSCRFLHPGVTDKGNYNMFDVVRGVPPAGAYPPPAPRDLPPPESAWERGLRTAKEMLRIANKRKEQDMDFEEKKLHLSVGGVVHDPDAELAYAAAAVGASPPPPHHHEMAPPHRDPYIERAYGPGPVYRPRYPRPVDEREYYERERVYERERGYERAPPYDERMPPVDEGSYHKRRIRTAREVIVQRAEIERRSPREVRELRASRDSRDGRDRERATRDQRDPRDARDPRDPRADDWADPWMRAEPAARRRRPPSSDSYSSSSSSNSSSRSSHSPGTRRRRRASSSSRQRLSPSVIVRERRLATARATAMNPPAPRRRAPSPAAARLAANPPPPASHRHKDDLDPYGRSKVSSRNRDRKKYSRSSSSGSESTSSSSESDSESRTSSSSGSSGARRARHARLLNAAARPRMNAKSAVAAAVTIPNKKEAPSEKEAGKKRGATSPVSGAAPAKKSVSRREELLKQLKAVEDAIARKRSKI